MVKVRSRIEINMIITSFLLDQKQTLNRQWQSITTLQLECDLLDPGMTYRKILTNKTKLP